MLCKILHELRRRPERGIGHLEDVRFKQLIFFQNVELCKLLQVFYYGTSFA